MSNPYFSISSSISWMMNLMPWKLTPFERERRFMERLNLDLIQKLLWPLLGAFILLGFSDIITTLLALASSPGFVELNPLATKLFELRFNGFLLAYALKVLPAVPLLYMVAVRTGYAADDFQVRLLKFTAMVVLMGADIYLGTIVLGNNLPQLLGART